MDFLIILARRKRLLVALPLLLTVCGAVIAFVLPAIYKSTVRILPPQQSQSTATAVLAQLGSVAGISTGGMKNPSDMYVGMLKSRTVADNLIKKFKLNEAFEVDSIEKARKELAGKTSISASKDGFISIDFEDTDKKRAPVIANAYVTELTELTKKIAVTEAGQRRLFYERQLETVKNNLSKAEAALKEGLDNRGVVSVDVQSGALLATIGKLRAQVSAKEIELESMRAFVTTNNRDYKRVEEELSSTRAELRRLENGRNAGDSAPVSPRASEGGLESIKLLRDVKYYQMLYDLLAKQYEIARLDEAKDPGLVQILDPAIEPERKIKPSRVMIILMSAFAGLILAVIWAVVSEKWRSRLSTEEGAAKWRSLRAALTSRA
jgi:uncharacterized protein involved in exopolysaccharide biosynthesis